MRQGLKKFNSETQGARTSEGKKEGENYIKDILNIANIDYYYGDELLPIFKEIRKQKDKECQYNMTPDFLLKQKYDGYNIILESKYKQIQGSDWEKIESNFGFHNYYWNNTCKFKSKTIVILSGFWKDLQKTLYDYFVDYLKKIYGENSIFDFGLSVDEILRFFKFLNVDINNSMKDKIKKKFIEHKNI